MCDELNSIFRDRVMVQRGLTDLLRRNGTSLEPKQGSRITRARCFDRDDEGNGGPQSIDAVKEQKAHDISWVGREKRRGTSCCLWTLSQFCMMMRNTCSVLRGAPGGQVCPKSTPGTVLQSSTATDQVFRRQQAQSRYPACTSPATRPVSCGCLKGLPGGDWRVVGLLQVSPHRLRYRENT